MVERETVAPEERRLVAAVIYNRLKRNMPLGIDATLRYRLGIPGTRPLTSCIASSSPYNTRRFKGSADADRQPRPRIIRAAANPASVDYLYYVRKPDKIHHFFTADDESSAGRLASTATAARAAGEVAGARTLSLVRDPVTRRNANPGSLPRRRGRSAGGRARVPIPTSALAKRSLGVGVHDAWSTMSTTTRGVSAGGVRGRPASVIPGLRPCRVPTCTYGAPEPDQPASATSGFPGWNNLSS